LSSFGIGAKLRQERVGKGLAIDDISRDTRIAPRFLEAIETDDYSSLPGLVFTRNFVRQYALTLQLDPDPLLAELPKTDESTAPLPNPPARPRSSYNSDRRRHSILSSMAWLLVAGGAGAAAFMYFNHSPRTSPPQARLAPRKTTIAQTAEAGTKPPAQVSPTPASTPISPPGSTPGSAIRSAPGSTPGSTTAPVQVALTAHGESTWVQVSADGRVTFTGTLKPNETREVSAEEQVKVLTGNAGALTISLNGKILEAMGPPGQVREVKLTAEGPQLLTKAPPPAPDPL
jgi:cytoskeletal protein RodZ